MSSYQLNVGECHGHISTNACMHQTEIITGNKTERKIMTGKEIYRFCHTHSITYIGIIGKNEKDEKEKNQMEHFESRHKHALQKGQKRRYKYHKLSAEEKEKEKEEKKKAKQKKKKGTKRKQKETDEGGDDEIKEKEEKEEGTNKKIKKEKEKEKDEKEKEKKVPGRLEVQNVVDKGLTLSGISHQFIKYGLCGKYDDIRFPASTIHQRYIQSYAEDPLKYLSVSYANTGALNTAGPRTRQQGILAQHWMSYALAVKTGRPFKLFDVGPVNFATSMNCGYPIDLKRFEKEFKKDFTIEYHPSKFRGLHLELPKDNVVLVLFERGAVNAVGLKSEKHVKNAQEDLVPWLMEIAKRYHDEPLPKHPSSSLSLETIPEVSSAAASSSSIVSNDENESNES